MFVTAISPVYETAPVDAPEGSGDYLNAVVLIDTTLSAPRLMDRALAIEDAFDRERSDIRNAPRTLDVDLIVVGDRRRDRRASGSRTPRRRARVRAAAVGTTSSPTPSSLVATPWRTCCRRPIAAS